MPRYTVKQAAEALGISEQRVLVLLAEGRLKGERFGRVWVVTKLEYTRKRGQTGRPEGIVRPKTGGK